MTLSGDSATAIKATAGQLESKGAEVCYKMYADIFANHSDLKGIFNPSEHTDSGNGTSTQSTKFAAALTAYAKHCDDEAAFADTVSMIGAKHKILGIKDEHFPALGDCLIKAMKDVLGTDDATNAAWKEGFDHFSSLIIAASK